MTLPQTSERALCCTRLVVLVIREHPGLDLVVCQQVPRVPSVLGQYEIDAPEDVDRAETQVSQVSYWGTDDVQRPDA